MRKLERDDFVEVLNNSVSGHGFHRGEIIRVTNSSRTIAIWVGGNTERCDGFSATNGNMNYDVAIKECKLSSKKLSEKITVGKPNARMGIEFECVVYARNRDAYNKLVERVKSRKWINSDDCTIRTHSFSGFTGEGSIIKTHEFKTKTYTDFQQLIKDIKYVFNIKKMSINETKLDKDIRIDFNETTGTHIHFSSKTTKFRNYANLHKAEEEMKRKYGSTFRINTKTPATQELFYFRDIDLIRKMRTNMLRGIKHEGVKKGFNRPYSASTALSIVGRGAIHVGGNNKGTIEFRMCNLNGVKTNELYDTITQQIKLVLNTISYGYQMGQKEVKKKAIAKLAEAKKLREEAEEEITNIDKAHKELMETFKRKKVKVDGKNDINLFQ